MPEKEARSISYGRHVHRGLRGQRFAHDDPKPLDEHRRTERLLKELEATDDDHSTYDVVSPYEPEGRIRRDYQEFGAPVVEEEGEQVRATSVSPDEGMGTIIRRSPVRPRRVKFNPRNRTGRTELRPEDKCTHWPEVQDVCCDSRCCGHKRRAGPRDGSL